MKEYLTEEMLIHCLRYHQAQMPQGQEQSSAYMQIQVRLGLCVSALPCKEQQAVRETYMRGDKVAAAALRLQISRNTLSKYRRLGLAHLQELYHSDRSDEALRELGWRSLLGDTGKEREYDRLQAITATAGGADRG